MHTYVRVIAKYDKMVVCICLPSSAFSYLFLLSPLQKGNLLFKMATTDYICSATPGILVPIFIRTVGLSIIQYYYSLPNNIAYH